MSDRPRLVGAPPAPAVPPSIQQLTSADHSVAITDPTGPVTDLSVAVGKLGWQGQALLPVTAAGLVIVPGMGILARTNAAANELLLDTYQSSAAEEWSFFYPGLVAPTNPIAKWRNRNPSDQATVMAIQANLITAPTAGDAANFYELVLKDIEGKTLTVPISTAGQNYYDLDNLVGTQLFGFGTGTAWTSFSLGSMWEFKPTGTFTVGGWFAPYLGCLAGDFFATTIALTARFILWDANWNNIAEATASIPAGSNQRTNVSFAFPTTEQLVAGQVYRLTLDLIGNGQYGEQNNPYTILLAGINGTINPGDYTTQRTALLTANNIPPAGLYGFDWPQLPAGTATYTINAATGTKVVLTAGAGRWSGGAVLGTPSGVVPMNGDITASLAAVGAPVAGAAGSNLNARALILPT